jgi:hypothetical protein
MILAGSTSSPPFSLMCINLAMYFVMSIIGATSDVKADAPKIYSNITSNLSNISNISLGGIAILNIGVIEAGSGDLSENQGKYNLNITTTDDLTNLALADGTSMINFGYLDAKNMAATGSIDISLKLGSVTNASLGNSSASLRIGEVHVDKITGQVTIEADSRSINNISPGAGANAEVMIGNLLGEEIANTHVEVHLKKNLSNVAGGNQAYATTSIGEIYSHGKIDKVYLTITVKNNILNTSASDHGHSQISAGEIIGSGSAEVEIDTEGLSSIIFCAGCASHLEVGVVELKDSSSIKSKITTKDIFNGATNGKVVTNIGNATLYKSSADTRVSVGPITNMNLLSLEGTATVLIGNLDLESSRLSNHVVDTGRITNILAGSMNGDASVLIGNVKLTGTTMTNVHVNVGGDITNVGNISTDIVNVAANTFSGCVDPSVSDNILGCVKVGNVGDWQCNNKGSMSCEGFLNKTSGYFNEAGKWVEKTAEKGAKKWHNACNKLAKAVHRKKGCH